MPVHQGHDAIGGFYQWGSSGKKYHYKAGNAASRARARAKAEKQGAAAHASGYRD